MPEVYKLLDAVHDRDSFIEFVRALADERESAEEMERSEPLRYSLGGAHDWQCGNISSFLYGCLDYFGERPLKPPPGPEASWRVFAEILWFAKSEE